MRHHDDVAEQPAPLDPVAVAVWQHGLNGAPASAALVIHAPHASDLVAPDSHHRDAA